MSAPFQHGPHSFTSYGSGGYRGRIENINDPEKRNRVQVRIMGYQDDQGNITKDMLEWIHVQCHDSQIPGATSTQPFYAGATVNIMDNGTERYVVGAVPGFDTEKKLQSNAWGVDRTSHNKPDTPNILRGDKQSSIASSPGLNPGGPDAAKNYFKYTNWDSMLKDVYKYAIGRGEPPSPFGKGTVAKLDKLQSLGIDKLSSGSDVLDVIRQLDGNFSGAFKDGIDIIKNLRNNGFGTGMATIGASLLSSSDAQFNNTFAASTISNDLYILIVQLNNDATFISSLNADNIYAGRNRFPSIITTLSDIRLGVSQTYIDAINGQIDILNILSLSASPNYAAIVSTIQSAYMSALQQAVTSIISLIISMIAAIGNNANPSDIVNTFGGNDHFLQLVSSLLSLGVRVGIAGSVINNIGNGLFGQAISGQLPRTVSNIPSSSSSSSPNMSQLIGEMSKFVGNSVAIKELLSGQLVHDFLTGNPRKYADNPRNHPKKKFVKDASDVKPVVTAGPNYTPDNVG